MCSQQASTTSLLGSAKKQEKHCGGEPSTSCGGGGVAVWPGRKVGDRREWVDFSLL